MKLVLTMPVGVEQQTGAIGNDTLATCELLQLKSHSSDCSSSALCFRKRNCRVSLSLENLPVTFNLRKSIQES